MQTNTMKLSVVDLMASILTGGDGVSLEAAGAERVLAIIATMGALVVGCLVLVVWRWSAGRKPSKPLEPPKPLVVRDEPDEIDSDDGKKRVTVFFGTQTGTAEGFAKVLIVCGFVGIFFYI